MAETRASQSNRREWTSEQVQQLRQLASGNTPVGVMSIKLGRPEAAVRSKAHAEGISLAPANRPPYGEMR